MDHFVCQMRSFMHSDALFSLVLYLDFLHLCFIPLSPQPFLFLRLSDHREDKLVKGCRRLNYVIMMRQVLNHTRPALH